MCGFVAEHGDGKVLPDGLARRPQVSLIAQVQDLDNRLERGIDETLIEIKERPLPERRNRHYDRVVKRTQVGDKLIKRTKHKQRLYDDPPAVHVFGAA